MNSVPESCFFLSVNYEASPWSMGIMHLLLAHRQPDPHCYFFIHHFGLSMEGETMGLQQQSLISILPCLTCSVEGRRVIWRVKAAISPLLQDEKDETPAASTHFPLLPLFNLPLMRGGGWCEGRWLALSPLTAAFSMSLQSVIWCGGQKGSYQCQPEI